MIRLSAVHWSVFDERNADAVISYVADNVSYSFIVRACVSAIGAEKSSGS